MRVALHKTRDRDAHVARGPNVDRPAEPGFGQSRDHLRIDAVPRRNEHRRRSAGRSVARARFCPAPARRSTWSTGRCAPELPVARTGRRVVAMRVAVLDDRRHRRFATTSTRLGFDERRNDGERDGNVRVRRRCRAAAASAGESRQASSSRHQRSARRPAARQASSSSSRRCQALIGLRVLALGARASARAPRRGRPRWRRCAPRRRCRSSTFPSARACRPRPRPRRGSRA